MAASFSSGGFSNIFARPSYQDGAVQQYFNQLGSTNAGLFNTSGRGFPDISAQSVNFFTWIADELFFVLGTSASTPTWASVIALLNDARLNAGKPSLGFINPLLYSQGAAALNDITSGSNPGCGRQGFPALSGWDPVCYIDQSLSVLNADMLFRSGNWAWHSRLQQTLEPGPVRLTMQSTCSLKGINLVTTKIQGEDHGLVIQVGAPMILGST